jgi:DNA-directed RNA polymerase subunit M/transcription elongation factor TFIIS
MAHEHGIHLCYCPNCNTKLEVDADVKCNTLTCPNCGARMRAEETGERRALIANKEVTMVSVAANNVPCAVCNYPIPEATYVGQQIKCPWCGSINEAIAQVTIPTPVFVGLISFGLGVLLGPALLATTAAGQSWMERQIRERIK